MSWAAIKWIHWARDLSTAERAVLSVLAYKHNDETGVCAPGRTYLMRHTGLSKNGLMDNLHHLAGVPGVGWYQVERRQDPSGRTDNVQYSLHIDHYPPGHEPLPGEPGAPPDPQGAVGGPSRGQKAAGGGGDSAQGEGAGDAPVVQRTATTRGPTRQLLKPRGGDLAVFELPAGVTLDDWNGWVEMRKKIPRAPFTARAEAAALRILHQRAAAGEDVAKLLEIATASSWRGLHWPVPTGAHGGRTGRPDTKGTPLERGVSAIRRGAGV